MTVTASVPVTPSLDAEITADPTPMPVISAVVTGWSNDIPPRRSAVPGAAAFRTTAGIAHGTSASERASQRPRSCWLSRSANPSAKQNPIAAGFRPATRPSR